MDTRFIYVLSIDGTVHYVGKTKDIYVRARSHKKKYPNSKFEVIDEIPADEWRFWERHYISLFRSWGFILDNKKLHGGNGCDVVSEETKKKQSEIKKGKPLSATHKANLFKAYGEDWHKIHTADTLGGWKNVKNHTEESKQKMSDAKKGKPAWNKGKSASDEARRKMSDAKKGKPSAFKGKTHSEESRKKLSVACKGRRPWNKK